MDSKFLSRLHPVEAGQVIVISGKTAPTANQFYINLESGNGACQKHGDIQFHLSVRFNECLIVRNTHKKCGGWEKEERQENLFPHCTANPIGKGEDFKIAIYIDASAFFVSINEKPFCFFPHRMPLKDIQQLTISKDIQTIYQVDHTSAPPKRWPLKNPIVFTGLVPKQFKAGSVIVIAAIPRGNRENFVLNFRHVGSGRVMFHLRPYLASENIVVNAQNDSFGWLEQINHKESPYPFAIDRKFKLAIAITSNSFNIAVNGQMILAVPFREDNANIYQFATGPEITCNNGLKMDIESINHMMIESNCQGFERFTN